MVQWISNLYIGDRMQKRIDRVMASIDKREVTYNVYCIAIATSDHNLLDIIDANELLFPYYRNRTMKVVGLAKGKQEAVQLVEQIIVRVYQETGGFDVRAYFT